MILPLVLLNLDPLRKATGLRSFVSGIFADNVRKAVLLTLEFNVSASRLVSRNDFGVSKAKVTISGGNLKQPIHTTTNGFGYYKLPIVDIDHTYTVTVAAKGLSFSSSSQSVELSENVVDVDFIAN